MATEPREMPGQGLPLSDLYRIIKHQFENAGIGDSGREARRLIGVLGAVPAERFLADPNALVEAERCRRVLEGAEKRALGMSVGRVAGTRDFYGRAFRLGPAILEPRLDSEVLVEAVLEIVRGGAFAGAPIRIVDVGTGSGCLLLTLLAELPGARGTGIDISGAAIDIARANAADLGLAERGLAERAIFVTGDALQGIETTFDVLISNPPYIRTADLAGLEVAVRDHDPALALDGGADGMEIYRRIARDVMRVVPDGWMFFEVGAGMADAVCHEIDAIAGDHHNDQRGEQRGWRVWPDLNGHARCVAAKTLNA